MILLIEDDNFWVSMITKMLAPASVLVARNGIEGLELFERNAVDLVITDLVMPEKDGIATIIELRKRGTEIPILAISGGGNVGSQGDLLRVAMQVGATETLAKPFGPDALTMKVGQCLARGKTPL